MTMPPFVSRTISSAREPASGRWAVTGVPILSPGRHRKPSKGACFMEFASFLAGEPWSDHPACTHPLLAALAREVNDSTSDDGRRALVPLIPSVVGLTTDDPRLAPALVLRCVGVAMESACASDQFVLAVALIRAEQVLAELEQAGPDQRETAVPSVEAPSAIRRRAADFLRSRPRPQQAAYQKRGAPQSLAAAVQGIVRAGSARTDDLLRLLLCEAIEECRRWTPNEPVTSNPEPDAQRVRGVPAQIR